MKPGEYIKGDRRGRGAHDIELEAMRDPFLADALEGLESAGGDHAETVAALDRRIAARAADAAAGATDKGSARGTAGERALGRRTDATDTSDLAGKTDAAAEKTAPGRSRLTDRKKPVTKEASANGTEFGEKRYPDGNGKPDGKSTNGRRYLWRTIAAAAAILIALTVGMLTLRHTPAPGTPGEVPPLADNRPNHPAKADSSDGTRSGQPEDGQTSAGERKPGTNAEPGNGTESGNGTHPLAGVDATNATPDTGKQRKQHSGKEEEQKPGKQPMAKGQPDVKLPDKEAAGTRQSATQPPTEGRDNERQPTEQPRTGQQPAKKPELQELSGSTDIDDVVVVAYGMSKKTAFTGSTGSGAAANVLHSKASESAPAIRIRGTGGTKRDTATYRYTVDGNACTDIAWVKADSVASISIDHRQKSIAIRTKGADALAHAATPDGNDMPTTELSGNNAKLPRAKQSGDDMPETKLSGDDQSATKLPGAKLSGDDLSFATAETMPRFRGGSLDDFRQWVQARIRKPQIALHNGIGGRVVVAFTIDTLGRLTDIEVLQTPDKSLSDETVRVLKQSPSWEPGRQRDKKVRVKHTLPVYFGEENKPREKPTRKKTAEKPVRKPAEGKPRPETHAGETNRKKPQPEKPARKPAEEKPRPETHDRQAAEEKPD